MKLSIAPDVTVTPMEAGAVVLDGRRGRYWQLNATGAAVLQTLRDGRDAEAAADLLSADGAVTAEQALADVRALIDSLIEARLLEVAP
jgi:hypothetical protein